MNKPSASDLLQSSTPKLNSNNTTNYIQNEQLRSTIINLEQQLKDQKKILFLNRFLQIFNNGLPNISNIKISTDVSCSMWNITYLHKTEKYDENNYAKNPDSEVETDLQIKHTEISLGINEKNKKYFIKSASSTRFKIYHNSKNELRLINVDYDIELDLDEQADLMKIYSSNIDIPEYCAIRFFLYVIDLKWTNKNICNYFGIV